jgi:DnaJ-class molecular chaperone
MTKAENRELAKAFRYSAAGLGPDYLARALSAMYRSARSAKSQNEILAIARAYSVLSNPEFLK